MGTTVIILLSFVAYLIFVMGIGFYFSKKNKTMDDYFIGGRGLGSWVVALSAQASDMSGWLLMGLPGAIYFSGIGEIWLAVGLAIGTYLNWKFVAKRLRNFSKIADDAITIPQYFQNRFLSKNNYIQIVCAIIVFVFFLFYTASGFSAAAKLIVNVFGLNYYVGLTIGVVVIMAYTFIGGYMAVCWTDFFQGLLMFGALLLVPLIAYFSLDPGSFVGLAEERPDLFTLGNTSTVSIISSLSWGLGYFGMPHILIRFMSIESAEKLKKSRRIATLWVIISLTAAICVGVIGYVYLTENGVFLTTSSEAETVFIELVKHTTPPVVAGVLLCAIVSAIMSTADSQLLVTASSVSDGYNSIKKGKVTDKKLVNIGRYSVLAIAVLAYIMALDQDATVMSLVSYGWAGFAASFGPAMLLSLYWRDMKESSIIIGMLSGGLTVIIWEAMNFELYSALPGFIVSSLVIILVSKLDKRDNKEVEALFDKGVSLD